MKIVFLHTDFKIYWPLRLEYLQKNLMNFGHELLVIEISGSGSPYSFAKENNNCRSWWHCLFANKRIEEIIPKEAVESIRCKLDELKPDIVFSGSIAFSSGAGAVAWCRSNKIPLVIFDDARLADVPRPWYVTLIKKRIFSNVDAVFIPALSHSFDYIFWGIPKDKIFYGLNVVDNKKWRDLVPNTQVLQNVKNEMSLPNRFILGVGRHVPKKNWIKLVKSFYNENIKERLPFSLVLIGEGPSRDDIETFMRDNYVENIHLFDFQPPEELAKFYALADALVLPSAFGETWGLVVNETMACGTPVLVSKQCGCCETLVIEGETGYSFDPNCIDEISSVLQKISNMSRDELNEMGKKAQNHIANWGLERFEQGVKEAIAEVIKTPAKGYKNIIDRIIIKLWKGRYRPT